MKFFPKLFLFALSFAAYLSFGSTLKCYQCNSLEHKECLDVTGADNKTFLSECPLGPNGENPFCRKTKITLIGKVEIQRTDRSCGWSLEKKYPWGTEACINGNNEFKRERNCQCFTEGCNSAPHLHPLAFLIPTAMFIVLYHLMF